MLKLLDQVYLKGSFEFHPDGFRMIYTGKAISRETIDKQQAIGFSFVLKNVSGEVRKIIKNKINVVFDIVPGLSIWCYRIPIKYVKKINHN